MVTTVEELFEMTGVLVFIRGLLLHIAAHFQDFTIRFAEH
jgi:hypothetical protein